MGKFKCTFVTCLALGLAAGAGYYLYRKYASRKSEESNSVNQKSRLREKAQQSDAEKEVEDTKHEDVSETSKTDKNVQETDVAKPGTSTQETESVGDGSNNAVGREPIKENSNQTSGKDEPAEKLENPTNPQTQTKKKKSNFGGLKKGFLL